MIDWLPQDWIAAATSSTVTVVLGFVAGAYYKAKVEKSIQHNLDIRLEAVKAAIRKDEEALRADLRAKGDQIAALRGGALSGLANRFAAVDKRRLEAIDKLWSSTVKESQFKLAARMTRTIKMDVALDTAAKQDADGANVREFADVIWKACGLDNLKPVDPPDSERPFIPPLAWALFSAYRQVLGYPVAQLAAMREGVGSRFIADPKSMLDLVKSALPHQAEFVDEFGTLGLSYLIDDLEEALLKELRRSLYNPDADQANVEQAAAILKAADKLAQSSHESINPPTGFRAT